ncbi:uncharacterized protein [Branchiostoma lanceolatum]|uniref:uncharacterized protein n=1 Tax=Branchiostoma lanceolatum TaxID=7740 RepID=UPI00345522F6
MQHPSLFLSIVCLLFALAARPVALRRLARSVLRHRGPLICREGTYASEPTRSCEPCGELCQPQRGTQRECELRCKGFSIPTVIAPLHEKETATQETAALRPTSVVAPIQKMGSEDVQAKTGLTIWQIAEVLAIPFGCIMAGLAVLGYCHFQLRRQVQKQSSYSPGPASLSQQQPPSVHVAVSTPQGFATPPSVVSVGQQPRAAPEQPPLQLPQESPSLPIMVTAGERTAPSNTVHIYATDTKPHVHNVQNDLVEEDHVAGRQRTRQETEI